MSAAGKIALGAGLQAFGSIVNDNITARHRARQSLQEIAARGQIRSQELAEERDFQQSRDQNAFERERNAFERERNALSEDRQYQAGLLNAEIERNQPTAELERERIRAQINASNALATDRMRPPSSAAGGPTALQREIPLRFRQDSLRFASEQTPVYFKEYQDDAPRVETLLTENPAMASSLGITAETPLNEALSMVENALYRSRVEAYSGEFSPPQGLLSGAEDTESTGLDAEISEARAAMQRGVSVDRIRQELINQGAPQYEIEAIIGGLL